MRTTPSSLPPLLLTAVALTALAWGSGLPQASQAASPGQDAAPAAADHHVHQANIRFDPEVLTITAGETVEWDNHDFPVHTVTSDTGLFDSGDMERGDFWSHTFTQPGTYGYHCIYHGAQVGTIVVNDPDAAADLEVQAVEAEETVPALEQRITVTVANTGDGDAAASRLALRYLYQGEPRDLATLDVPALAAGEVAAVATTWDTLGKVGDFTLWADADAAGEVAERDEGDNRGTGTATVLVGGVDGEDLFEHVGSA